MPKFKVSFSEVDVKKLTEEWKRIDAIYSKSIASIAHPSKDLLLRAHAVFFEKENRDVFYQAARVLLPKAMRGQVDISMDDVLGILLQTWNRQYYRYRPWKNQHHLDIEYLCKQYKKQLLKISDKEIFVCKEGLQGDEGWIWILFMEFKKVLGPVGAAKALHLFAPAYFPLWDREIAKKAYNVSLDEAGYLAMMRLVKTQLKNIPQIPEVKVTLLKLIDEYNYCHYTKSWL